ncbi:MAG: carbohydrate-binding domain-containing protein [Firmicutes bacterium]|nr:carbohydrate-binding domain-containing protein [Bacillota bacterium]
MKHQYFIIIALLLAAVLLFSGCAGTEAATDEATVREDTTETTEPTANNETLENGEVEISLEGTTARAASDAVSVSGSAVTISEAGTYVLSGSLDNGSVIVDADKEAEVQLILNGVSVTSADFAAIYAAQADKVTVTLAEGTVNTLVNGGSFTSIDESNVDAVIFSKDDLELEGAGTLIITSPAGHGIVSKDDLTVSDGNYEIDAADTAIKANDSLEIAGGSFTLTAGADGLHAENNDDESLGSIYIGGGSFSVNASDDGVHATTVLQIDGGTFQITAAEGLEATCVTVNGGDISIAASDDGINAARKFSLYSPAVEINGGSITIVMGAGDTDGVDSNGDIVINGGTVDVTGNSTFDYDGTGVINGGTVIVNGQQVSTLPNQMMGGPGMGGPGWRP